MNNLKNAFSQLPEVKRIHEIEGFIDKNQEIQEMLKHLKDIQKKMVHAKEFNQPKQYMAYKKEYDEIYQEILDYPFVEEYLDLLEEVNQLLLSITNCIEEKINKEL
ncbi:MAG: YlbF family regulator [Anaeroplasmataceae bacterium]|nr:YlbF family regulator [Anaeroplasmataceae bacterium]